MSIDEITNSYSIQCTEEDSPFFGKDYNSLMPSQKKIHDLYVQGKIGRMNPEKSFEIYQKTQLRMKEYKREYIKKEHSSHINAKNLILNA